MFFACFESGYLFITFWAVTLTCWFWYVGLIKFSALILMHNVYIQLSQGGTFVFCFYHACESDMMSTTKLLGVNFCFESQSDETPDKTIVVCKFYKRELAYYWSYSTLKYHLKTYFNKHRHNQLSALTANISEESFFQIVPGMIRDSWNTWKPTGHYNTLHQPDV